MFYIYGDSHGEFSFKNMPIPNRNCSCSGITMFRIGRDNLIINFKESHNDEENVFCMMYGEIDCRRHIQMQIDSGHNEDTIIMNLVTAYFQTIQKNIKAYKQMIVVGVIPPTRDSDYYMNNVFPNDLTFVGSEENRVRYTWKVNALIEKLCTENGYLYFNPYEYYTRPDGTLKYEFSDKSVHLGDNTYFLNEFMKVYRDIFYS